MSREWVRSALFVLLAIDAALVLAYAVDTLLWSPSWTLHLLLDLDAEGTPAVWYISGKLLLASTLFLLLATGTTDPAVGTHRFLGLVGLALLLLSADETVGFHERITVVLRRFDGLPRFTGDHGMWIPLLAVCGTGFLAVTARSWRRLWRHERKGTLLLATGLLLGVAGAVGLEIVSYEVVRPSGNRVLYSAGVAAEEGLELLGATLLLVGSMLVFRTAGSASDGRGDPS